MTNISEMTNEQLAEALAIEVMGWRKDRASEETQYWWRNKHGVLVVRCEDWQPAEDIAQAVECAEKWANKTNAKIFLEYSNLSWQAATIETGAIRVNLINENLARALCGAVLMAVRGEGGEP